MQKIQYLSRSMVPQGIILLLFLLLTSCASTKKMTETEGWQKFCGCVPPKTASPEKKNDLSAMGTGDYLEKMYKDLREDFESSGTEFEHLTDGLSAKGIALKRVEGEDKKLREILIVIDGDISFATGKTTITPAAKAIITKITDAVDAFPETTVKIGGHTDSVGSLAGNLKISKSRAEAVKKEMQTQKNIAEERFRSVDGYADKEKLIDTMAAEPRNRRTEIRVGTVKMVL